MCSTTHYVAATLLALGGMCLTYAAGWSVGRRKRLLALLLRPKYPKNSPRAPRAPTIDTIGKL